MHLGFLHFAVLVSCLFHVLVIACLYFVQIAERGNGIVAGESAQRPALGATLRSAWELPSEPLAPRVQRPRREQGRGVSEPLVGERDEVASKFGSSTRSNLVPVPNEDYYATSELTVRPRAVGEAELDPEEIADIVASGRVVLELRINDQGAVVSVAVTQSDLPDVFSQVAVKAFQMLRFTPGELNGQRVGVKMQVEVRYDDNGVLRR